MRFGSDEVTYWIKMSVLDAKNEEWQKNLLDAVKQDVTAILRSRVPNVQDREEIISDVQYEVILNLSNFYRGQSKFEQGQIRVSIAIGVRNVQSKLISLLMKCGIYRMSRTNILADKQMHK